MVPFRKMHGLGTDFVVLVARARPLHAQAPVLLSRGVGILEDNGFASLALDAKRDFVARYGVDSEFRRAKLIDAQQHTPVAISDFPLVEVRS